MSEPMLPPEPAAAPPATPAAPAPVPGERLRLGLALAGGGFRASFFHLGVLRRLAELDVLRRVEVISTVSGGSIVGALYVLLLRERRLEQAGRLSRGDYLGVVARMEAELREGVGKNLRNRLLLNPLLLLRVVLTPFSLGNRMARLYERHLYGRVVRRLRARAALRDARAWPLRALRPGAFPLAQTRPVPAAFAPGGAVGELPGGIEAFNALEEQEPDGDAVPHLVLNATSMNSGGRFWFSSSEVGDWYHGYARPSEAARLVRLKRVREALAGRRPDEVDAGLAALAAAGLPCSRDEALLALWVAQEAAAERAEREGRPFKRVKADWERWADALSVACADTLATADFGRLRKAQVPAWYARIGRGRAAAVAGGMGEDELRQTFRVALRGISERLARDLERRRTAEPALEDAVMDLVEGVYALRSAAAVSPRLTRDLGRLTLGEAVGASACFPPVFSPFIIEGLYDDAHVGRLGLTDGGVFDNAGVTALLDERCACIIASDTGGVFETVPRASASRVGMLARLSLILQTDLGRHQREILRERRRFNRDLERIEDLAQEAGDAAPPAVHAMRDRVRGAREDWRLAGLAYFHIESATVDPAAEPEARAGVPGGTTVPGPLPPPADRRLLARVRTDLDGFGDVEIAALANQGYALADAYVRAYLSRFTAQWAPEVPWGTPPAYPWPVPAGAEAARATQIVRVGGERFFRSLRLLAHPATRTAWGLFPLAALIALVWGAWAFGPDAWAAGAPPLARAAAWLRGLPAWEGWRGWSYWTWVAVAAGGLVAGGALSTLTPGRASGTRRRAGRLRKYLPWALPWGLLLVLPVLRPWAVFGVAALVLGLALYAAGNHLFFYLPFRRATRVRA